MINCEFERYLGPYHDDELESAARGRVEDHLRDCPECQGQLSELRGLSGRIRGEAECEIEPAGLARLHESVDGLVREQWASASMMRTLGFLGAVAASVLVIGGVWLADLEGGPRETTMPAAQQVALAPEWERVAMTLHADPRPGMLDDSPFSPRYAAAVEWMLSRLSPTERKPWARPSSS